MRYADNSTRWGAFVGVLLNVAFNIVVSYHIGLHYPHSVGWFSFGVLTALDSIVGHLKQITAR